MVTGINDSGDKVSYKDIVEAVKPMFEIEYVLVAHVYYKHAFNETAVYILDCILTCTFRRPVRSGCEGNRIPSLIGFWFDCVISIVPKFQPLPAYASRYLIDTRA